MLYKDYLRLSFARLKEIARDVLIYLGDGAHRRAVAASLAWTLLYVWKIHVTGDQIEYVIGLFYSSGLAAWSHHTPKIAGDAQ